MTETWTAPAVVPGHLMLSLQQAGEMLGRLGQSGRDAVAGDLLRLVDAQVPLAQCTIFSFEAGRRPHIVAIGDRSRTRNLPHISDAYVTRFWRLDPLLEVMQQEFDAARVAGALQPRILLHRQGPGDITHASYRSTCYTLPKVTERLAILALLEGNRWFSINLYRGVEHGPFSAADLQVVEAFAPVIVHAVRLHHTGRALDTGLADMLLARLARRFPELTKRDSDVVRCLMQGDSTEVVAERLGLTLASARTYQKRVYRKLGVGGARELLGLLMEPQPSSA